MKKLIFLLALSAFAQYPLTVTPYQAIYTAGGVAVPCSGCYLYTYSAGTTTPLATYTSYTLGVSLPNPIRTNTAGYAVSGSGAITGVWTSGTACYHIVFKDAAAVTVFDQDHVCNPAGAAAALQALLATSAGAGMIGYTYPSSGVTQTVQARLQQYVSVADFGILPDGTDSTSKVNSMLSTLSATGGADIFFPPGSAGNFYKLGCITFPNDGGSPTPKQNPFILHGAGAYRNHPQSAPIYPNVGSVIVNTCTSGTSALIDTRGNGSLEIYGLSFINTSGSDVSWYIHDTNTVLNIHDNVFAGRVRSGAQPTQDIMRLGGTTRTESGGFDVAFQGYGTRIWNNEFMYGHDGVILGTFANGVIVDGNDWVFGNGATGTTHGAIVACGEGASCNGVSAIANTITNNIVEVSDGGGTVHYQYPFNLVNGLNTVAFGDGCYDADGALAGACFFIRAGASPGTSNIIINSLTGAAGSFVAYDDNASSTIIQGGPNGLISEGSGSDIGVDAFSAGDATLSTYIAGVRKWSLYNTRSSGCFGHYDWVHSVFRINVCPDGNITFNTPTGSTAVFNSVSGDSEIRIANATTQNWSLYSQVAGANLGIYDVVNSTFRMKLSQAGAIVFPTMGTGTSGGGLYVCIDNTGALYKKSSCP